MHLWNHLYGGAVYDVDVAEFADIFMLLDDEETEDLVFLYLQAQGWYVVPNSRKGDSMSYEFLLVHPEDKNQGVVQVKTGNTRLNIKDHAGKAERVYLFQANELYDGPLADNVVCIKRAELEQFIADASTWLPRWLMSKVSMAQGTSLKGLAHFS